ncbi:hypothetical protein BH09PLA1_BH09PLA1_06660 [soil metagenome]
MPLPRANRRWMILAVAVLAIAGTIAFFWRTVHLEQIAFLNSYRGANWIVFPTATFGGARPAVAFDTTFRKTFDVATIPASAMLRARALRNQRIVVNDQPVQFALFPGQWQDESSADISRHLHVGENTIVATITNPTGPGALWLRLESDSTTLATDESWQASLAGSSWRAASLARSPSRPDPDALVTQSMTPFDSLAQRWPTLLLFTLISALVVAGLQRVSDRRNMLVLASFAVVLLTWGAMLVHNSRWLPPSIGFDSAGHRAYIQFILDHGRLPLPNDGWQMYQAPLYYMISAGVLKLFGLSTQDESWIHILRVINFSLGALNVLFVVSAMKLLFPHQPRRWLIGLLLAGFLPANLYLQYYPANEILAATLISAATLVSLRIIKSNDPRWPTFTLLGAVLGAATLAKVSAIIPAAVILFALSVRAIRNRLAIRGLALAIGACLLVGGWHYVRIWRHFGKPFVSNWDSAGGFNWWQDPGYRTAADFLHFGSVFVRPIFNLNLSVPNSLYATLWGDALCGGAISADFRPPWSFDLMCVGYVLAIVPSIFVIVGIGGALLRLARRDDAAWAMLLSILFIVVGAICYLALQAPHYGSAKAHYGLIALIPFCALATLGIETLSFGNRRVYSVLAVLFGVWVINSGATYWIRGDDAVVRTLTAARLIAQRQDKEAEAMLGSALQIDPASPDARFALANFLVIRKRYGEARKWLDPVPGQPDDARRHILMATIESAAGQQMLAASEVDRAIQLDPTVVDFYLVRAELAQRAGRTADAITAYRDALALNPYIDIIHRRLAKNYDLIGDTKSAEQHRRYLSKLPAKPLQE